MKPLSSRNLDKKLIRLLERHSVEIFCSQSTSLDELSSFFFLSLWDMPLSFGTAERPIPEDITLNDILKVLNENVEIFDGDIQAFDNFVANRAHITILPSNYRRHRNLMMTYLLNSALITMKYD